MTNKPIVLIIDDDPYIQGVIIALLKGEGYELISAANGIEGLERAAQILPDVILLDVMMPDMDGYEVCRRIRSDKVLCEIPIVIITSLEDRSARLEGLNSGADDYLTKPIDKAELRARLRTITRLNRYRLLNNERARFETLVELSPDPIFITDEEGILRFINQAAISLLQITDENDPIGEPFVELLSPESVAGFYDLFRALVAKDLETLRHETVLQRRSNKLYLPVDIHAALFEWGHSTFVEILARDISDIKLTEMRLKQAYETLQESLEEAIQGWARILEFREHEATGHIDRVVYFSVEIGQALGLSQDQLLVIKRGAALHDIGKIGIPDGILLKPGKLTEEEWAIIRKHPIYAYDMLSSIFFLMPATIIPLYHHERWDGSGYPQGLQGEEIPLEARIFAVVDVWDSLISDRPYRPKWKAKKAREYIGQQSGIQFDPRVVDVFMRISQEKFLDVD